MNILVLHNNNLPDEIVDLYQDNNAKNRYYQEPIVMSPNESDTFDVFVSKRCKEIFSIINYDLIILPFTLNKENYTDFSGIRLGMHLRLDVKTDRIPLLFLGVDQIDEIARLTELGSVLFTPKVFVSSVQTKLELESLVDDLDNEGLLSKLSDNEYELFINRIKITDLENLGPHAIANIWAIQRWSDMFGIHAAQNSTYLDFQSQLNFKYIHRLSEIDGKHQSFKKNQQESCIIPNIQGKKIVYIDDELLMGWGEILKAIFDSSGAELCCWKPVPRSLGRVKTINNIKSFIDDNRNADCYIVDLRLTEEDTVEKDFRQLSGHAISKYIREINKANQIVIFTASNKIWNLKEEIDNNGALGYVLKESPLMGLNRQGSVELYNDFARLIQNATALSRLKKLVVFQKKLEIFSKSIDIQNDGTDLTGLYNSIDLLLLDKHIFSSHENDFTKNPISMELVKSVVLNLCVFLETYLKNRYRTVRSVVPTLYKKNKYAVKKVESIKTGVSFDVEGKIFLLSENLDGYSRVCDVKLSDTPFKPTKFGDGWDYLFQDDKKENDLATILASLYAFYGFDERCIRIVALFKDIRNSAIAHKGGVIDVDPDDVWTFYLEIVNKIFKKDYPNNWE